MIQNGALLNALRTMIRIRVTEETIADHYPDGHMRTPTHFSIGQEAPAAGVCGALEADDVVYSGHRCHAHYLAKGGNLAAMVAELHGRESGCAKGRGGSVHLSDPAAGFLAASAILGETIATAVGTALAFKMDQRKRVAVAFFGDGCVEEGVFHEALNFAAVKQVPVLFVCENNLYSTHTGLAVRQPPGVEIFERARGYGMPALRIDGNNVEAVLEAASQAVTYAREAMAPYFLELMTYRWREHVGPRWDHDLGYRRKDEVEEWVSRCPIKHATALAIERKASTASEIAAWTATMSDEVNAAIDAAKASPFPSITQLLDNTY